MSASATGLWHVYRSGKQFVCGRMSLIWYIHSDSDLVYKGTFISCACSYTVWGWRMGLPGVAFVAIKDLMVCLSLFCFLLFQPFRNSGGFPVQKVDKGQGSVHFQISLLWGIVGKERMNVALEPFLPKVISILLKLFGVWGICSTFGLVPKRFQVLQAEKLQGVRDVPPEHNK